MDGWPNIIWPPIQKTLPPTPPHPGDRGGPGMTPPVLRMWQLGPWVGLLGSHGQDMTEEPSRMWPGILPSSRPPLHPLQGLLPLGGAGAQAGSFPPPPQPGSSPPGPELRAQMSISRSRHFKSLSADGNNLPEPLSFKVQREIKIDGGRGKLSYPSCCHSSSRAPNASYCH